MNVKILRRRRRRLENVVGMCVTTTTTTRIARLRLLQQKREFFPRLLFINTHASVARRRRRFNFSVVKREKNYFGKQHFMASSRAEFFQLNKRASAAKLYGK
jgi:hypothetical protein